MIQEDGRLSAHSAAPMAGAGGPGNRALPGMRLSRRGRRHLLRVLRAQRGPGRPVATARPAAGSPPGLRCEPSEHLAPAFGGAHLPGRRLVRARAGHHALRLGDRCHRRRLR